MLSANIQAKQIQAGLENLFEVLRIRFGAKYGDSRTRSLTDHEVSRPVQQCDCSGTSGEFKRARHETSSVNLHGPPPNTFGPYAQRRARQTAARVPQSSISLG